MSSEGDFKRGFFRSSGSDNKKPDGETDFNQFAVI